MDKRITLLIAEDDENDRFLIARAFARAGTDAIIAFVRDGQETIEYLQKISRSPAPQSPQLALLLLDLKMPRLDGFQVLKWLTQNPGLRPRLIVVLSSSSDPMDTQRAEDLGADSYITKPHNASEYPRIAEELRNHVASPQRHPSFPTPLTPH
jgi:CheY-like chemotaxis protein